MRYFEFFEYDILRNLCFNLNFSRCVDCLLSRKGLTLQCHFRSSARRIKYRNTVGKFFQCILRLCIFGTLQSRRHFLAVVQKNSFIQIKTKIYKKVTHNLKKAYNEKDHKNHTAKTIKTLANKISH